MATAAAPSSADTTQKSYAYKVPTGGERDRNAMCNWLGGFMSEEMKGKSIADLKRVPAEEIRDGSVPMVQPVTESVDPDFKDDAHVADKVPELAHINHPKEGEIIQDRFSLHFVDPRTYDRKIRLLFYAGNDTSQEPKAILELETFGNQYKKQVQRPAGLEAGAYSESQLLSHMIDIAKFLAVDIFFQ